MAKRRKAGEGTLTKRKDGRWEARVVVSYDEKGMPKTKNVTAVSKAKCLEKLEKLPMIRVNPNNPEQQKSTPAAKLYKEFLQQYTNVIKVVARATGEDDKVEDSPLRAWVNSRNADN